ncbi:hypothetical protein GCM10011379_34320 [Filimonas zeae]|uniref:Uncharacterized protein n=1 Tax=Filimonas zeae TaxID=1737353 RepID=A0A917J2L4_9BACT|nr:hypothetical protein GCM10011379_34320 [Filimonas zeae]
MHNADKRAENSIFIDAGFVKLKQKVKNSPFFSIAFVKKHTQICNNIVPNTYIYVA